MITDTHNVRPPPSPQSLDAQSEFVTADELEGGGGGEKNYNDQIVKYCKKTCYQGCRIGQHYNTPYKQCVMECTQCGSNNCNTDKKIGSNCPDFNNCIQCKCLACGDGSTCLPVC